MAGLIGDINNNLMGLQQLAMGRQQIQQNQELAANNKLATENLRKYYSSEQSGNPDFAALQEAFLLSPDMSQRMLQGAGITDKRKGQDAASYAIEAYGAIDDPERFVDLTQKRIQYLQAQGRDASQSIGALEAYMGGKKEQVKNGTKLLLASLTNQGYLDKDVYGQLAGAEERARKAELEERAMKVDERNLSSSSTGIQSSNILDDGTVIQVLKSGETKVVDPSGTVLTGQARAEAIKNAQNYGVDIQSKRAGGRTGASEGAKDIAKYKTALFDSINNGNRTLNKYEMAIKQIDKGAESGPVMKMLPSLQDSTLLMDTIRKDIGMEIVGSGVLGVNPTDADVRLAMEVAIPEGLRPDVLRKEIKRRAQVIDDLNSAQREYYKMLDSGKTKGDILRMAEEKRASQPVSRFKIEVSD